MRKYELLSVSLLAVCVSIESCYAACTANTPTFSCMSGYYGSPTSLTSTNCTACPAATHGGTVSSLEGSNTSITSCQETFTPTGCTGTVTYSYRNSTPKGYSTLVGTPLLVPQSGYYKTSADAALCLPCPTAPSSNWTVGSYVGSGFTVGVENCYITGTPAGCSSGTVKSYWVEDDGYSDSETISSLTPKDGYYGGGLDNADCYACPTADSGWVKHSYGTAGSTCTSCFEVRGIPNCTNGGQRRNAQNCSSYSSSIVTTTYATVAQPGYYLNNTPNATACLACPDAENTYDTAELDSYLTATSGGGDMGTCFLDSGTTYYNDIGEFELEDECYYDESASSDLL